jgi:hypothetical protein
MYIDSAREKDLYMLNRKLNDPTIPVADKRRYNVAHKKIMVQLKDRKLSQLRERLTRAYFAEDKLETWKITNQIKDYLGEQTFEEGTM